MHLDLPQEEIAFLGFVAFATLTVLPDMLHDLRLHGVVDAEVLLALVDFDDVGHQCDEGICLEH
jgi:hypothetical protein